MNITVRCAEIQNRGGDALVVSLFESAKPTGATGVVDKAVGGLIGAAIESGDFTGRKNQTLLLYAGAGLKARRILVVGLGLLDDFDAEAARQAAGTAARRLQDLGVTEASTVLHGSNELGAETAAESLAEASELACYRFDVHRTDKPASLLARLTVVEPDKRHLTAARRGVVAGLAIGSATCLARDLVNQPGNKATPSYLATEARRLARHHGLQCRILTEADMKRLGMGGLLGVTRGTSEPARFIVLEHRGKSNPSPRSVKGRRPPPKPLVLVGKGVTFDSGGISIKPAGGMEDMKGDMAGAAAVMGALQAVAALRIPTRVIGLIPATENLPGGKAYKPGDVLTTMSGKTVEIISTDAEGRLILADALTYASRYKPAGVVDLATLTGACVVALGHHASGMMANDDSLAERVRQAGEATAERVWPLPLWPEFREQIDSPVADMKNSGGRAGGAETAAALLSEFAQGYPWAHLDIAGTARARKAQPYVPKGAVGVGVRLLTRLARDWDASRGSSAGPG